MKLINRCVVAVSLLSFGAAALCQETNVLANCLGKGWSAYSKAFEDSKPWKKNGALVDEYKTGEAKLEVIQAPGSKVPNFVNAYFYQEPKRDWKSALRTCGLSTEGVKARTDSHHKVHLTHIGGVAGFTVEAVFIPMESPTSLGPELHLKLLKK